MKDYSSHFFALNVWRRFSSRTGLDLKLRKRRYLHWSTISHDTFGNGFVSLLSFWSIWASVAMLIGWTVMVNYWIISRINISRFCQALQIRNFNVLKLVPVFFLDLRNEIIYPESHFCESHWLLPCFVTTCSLCLCVFLFTCVGEAEWGARSYPPAVCGMAGPRCTWWPLRFPDVHQLSKREEERWRAINGTLQVTHTHTHTPIQPLYTL